MIEDGLRDSVDKDKNQLQRFINATEVKLETKRDEMIDIYGNQADILTHSMGPEV